MGMRRILSYSEHRRLTHDSLGSEVETIQRIRFTGGPLTQQEGEEIFEDKRPLIRPGFERVAIDFRQDESRGEAEFSYTDRIEF